MVTFGLNGNSLCECVIFRYTKFTLPIWIPIVYWLTECTLKNLQRHWFHLRFSSCICQTLNFRSYHRPPFTCKIQTRKNCGRKAVDGSPIPDQVRKHDQFGLYTSSMSPKYYALTVKRSNLRTENRDASKVWKRAGHSWGQSPLRTAVLLRRGGGGAWCFSRKILKWSCNPNQETKLQHFYQQ